MACFFVAALVSNILFAALADPQVPCLFIFGDSLVDNGNNNRINSLARANYLPYGIDFPNGATGRFSNGLTVVDVIGKFALLLFVISMAFQVVNPITHFVGNNKL